jgi:hypothetical protein
MASDILTANASETVNKLVGIDIAKVLGGIGYGDIASEAVRIP